MGNFDNNGFISPTTFELKIEFENFKPFLALWIVIPTKRFKRWAKIPVHFTLFFEKMMILPKKITYCPHAWLEHTSFSNLRKHATQFQKHEKFEKRPLSVFLLFTGQFSLLIFIMRGMLNISFWYCIDFIAHRSVWNLCRNVRLAFEIGDSSFFEFFVHFNGKKLKLLL